MATVASLARVSAVDHGESQSRAQRVRDRREALGMKIKDLAEEADVHRGHLGEYEAGKREVTEPWIRKVENALSRIETEVGMDASPPPAPHLIRITVEGVYGAKALIIEGAPEDQAQLEAMVDRIMRNLRGDGPQEPADS